MKSFVRSLVPAACLLAAIAMLAAPVAAQETPEKYLELLRSDVRAAKVEILTEALDLTPPQADAFWPLQREYEKELAVLGDRRVAMIKNFAASYGSIDDVQADRFAKDWFALQNDRTKLLQATYKKMAKAISPLVAARFVQAENLIGKLIELQIAAELPLIE